MKSNRTNSLMNPMTCSVVALGLILLFLIFRTPNLYRSGQTIFLGSPEPDDSLDKLLTRHEQNMQTDVDRFNGRSFFYTPPIVRKPPPPPPPPAATGRGGEAAAATAGTLVPSELHRPQAGGHPRCGSVVQAADPRRRSADPVEHRRQPRRHRCPGHRSPTRHHRQVPRWRPYDVSLINMELTPSRIGWSNWRCPGASSRTCRRTRRSWRICPRPSSASGLANVHRPTRIHQRIRTRGRHRQAGRDLRGLIRWWGRTPDTMRSLAPLGGTA